MAPIPITIITGFLGSGKTTILLNLIPQLPADYRLALLKNEFGDVAVDSQLASEKSIGGVRELTNGCICCNLVGQLSEALFQLRDEARPDRIVIETSGSAFPATLAMEVRRLMREHEGLFDLDGVISVVDVENWQGYEDTSITAKMQAKFTDLVVFNKWEHVPEARFEVCLDKLGDMEVETAWTKSEKGAYVPKDLLLGLDTKLLADDANLGLEAENEHQSLAQHGSGHDEHADDAGNHRHQSEVDVLSVTLTHSSPAATIYVERFLEKFLNTAPKDEVYRIKGIIRCSSEHFPTDDSGSSVAKPPSTAPVVTVDPSSPLALYNGGKSEIKIQNYILNWAFSRYTFTLGGLGLLPSNDSETTVARLTIILPRGSAGAWKYKINKFDWVSVGGQDLSERTLEMKRII